MEYLESVFADYLFLPPALWLVAAALILPLCTPWVRRFIMLALPAAVLALVWLAPAQLALDVLGHSLSLFVPSSEGRLFATAFALVLFAANLFALRSAGTLEQSAALFYTGGAIGAVLSGDFFSLFIFWELMAIGSTLIIVAPATKAAGRAALRYLALHALSGFLMLCGIVDLNVQTGDVSVRLLQDDGFYYWLILAAVLISAGAPPFSAWVADAYPEASPSGMVYLSALTTKTAVYALVVLFAGEDWLIYIGLYMIFYGIVYALLENDMRRILAYSIVNQVGFMVLGAGIGTSLALSGAMLHAFAHILYKALLLSSAGSVLFMTGERRCTHLGGLYRSMPLTTICGIVGALSISAFPLTSGYIVKPLMLEAALAEHHTVLWLALLAAGAGVFLHAGIKFPWFVFFQKDSGLRPGDPPPTMRWAMLFLAALCIAPGLYPPLLYGLLDQPPDYQPYTAGHVVASLQLLLSAAIVFFAALPWLKRAEKITLDWDYFYRRFPRVVGSRLEWLSACMQASWSVLIQRTLRPNLERAMGRLGNRQTSNNTLLLGFVAILIFFLVFYFGNYVL